MVVSWPFSRLQPEGLHPEGPHPEHPFPFEYKASWDRREHPVARRALYDWVGAWTTLAVARGRQRAYWAGGNPRLFSRWAINHVTTASVTPLRAPNINLRSSAASGNASTTSVPPS